MALLKEVFKSVRSGVLVVVVDHYGLTEFKFRCSPVYICVLLIANWKRIVTVVSAMPAGITLTDGSEAFLCLRAASFSTPARKPKKRTQKIKTGTGFHRGCHDFRSFLERGARAPWKKSTAHYPMRMGQRGEIVRLV